jgi:hypothetical protein
MSLQEKIQARTREQSGGWMNEAWVKELFSLLPALDSLVQRADRHRSFAFDYAIVVKLDKQTFVHRLVERIDFNAFHCTQLVFECVGAHARGEAQTSRWLEGAPELFDVRFVVNRHTLGLPNPIDAERAAWSIDANKKLVLDDHRKWMANAFCTYPGLKTIAKAANTARSPTTFALCTDTYHTWLKDPNESKVRFRMKTRRDAQRTTPPTDIWVAGPLPEKDGQLVFTREDFTEELEEYQLRKRQADQDREEAIAAGHERRQPERPLEELHDAIVDGMRGETKAESCTGCGCSLATNLQFGRGDSKLCGECEVKHDEENGERRVQHELVMKRRLYELPPPKKNTKFDPRPGIDDQGGFSSPTYED